ncbi:YciI family protein [Notoacmeibacter sp. MSK16QG-6]|uniref:YciI family protein n=1 Tax=Notoacmeibacter sp. MSK16QG-6 TaxID=2957982 RepID=UPI00209CA006|nr:YciI family protein [Notoacmeibacter sp. MSK16QG-6]MCP1199582.1 YciI family protein [Notoacmeibacter sp. MSK16QG-6]
MPQYALICRDAPGVLERRMAARADHMAGLKTEKAADRIVDGGAILNDKGEMVGSVVLCQFDSRADLDAYLEREVYAREGVWGDIEILPMRFVDWPKLMAG